MSSEDGIADAIVYLDEERALHLTDEMIKQGLNPLQILEECRNGMSRVGEKFEKGEFFLSEMIMAAEIFNQVLERTRPVLPKTVEAKGKILIGTVEGDVHDIGKNIMIALLMADGYSVIDLGVDVPATRFVEYIKQYRPDVVGMSSLLTVALESTKKTVDAIKEAGLRNKVKILIGGGRIDQYAADYIQPDAWTDNAAEGINLCRKLMEGAEN